MNTSVVVISVMQRDGCGFEITESTDEMAISVRTPREEVAFLLMVALGRAMRNLGPEVAQELATLRDLLRQLDPGDD